MDASHDLEQVGEESDESSRVQRATSPSDRPQFEDGDAPDRNGFALQRAYLAYHAHSDSDIVQQENDGYMLPL